MTHRYNFTFSCGLDEAAAQFTERHLCPHMYSVIYKTNYEIGFDRENTTIKPYQLTIKRTKNVTIESQTAKYYFKVEVAENISIKP